MNTSFCGSCAAAFLCLSSSPVIYPIFYFLMDIEFLSYAIVIPLDNTASKIGRERSNDIHQIGVLQEEAAVGKRFSITRLHSKRSIMCRALAHKMIHKI